MYCGGGGGGARCELLCCDISLTDVYLCDRGDGEHLQAVLSETNFKQRQRRVLQLLTAELEVGSVLMRRRCVLRCV